MHYEVFGGAISGPRRSPSIKVWDFLGGRANCLYSRVLPNRTRIFTLFPSFLLFSRSFHRQKCLPNTATAMSWLLSVAYPLLPPIPTEADSPTDTRPIHLLGPYHRRIRCLPRRFGGGSLAALPQDRGERALRLPRRMVSLRQRNDWRSIPRTSRLPDLHSNMLRSSLCTGLLILLSRQQARQQSTQVRVRSRHIQDIDVWRMDVCYKHR